MNDMTTTKPSMIQSAKALVQSFEKWEKELTIALSHGHGTHSLDDVFSLCLQGKCHFFDFGDCFMVMEVVGYPGAKIYHGFLAGGNMDSILAQEQAMGDLARGMQCSHLSIAGRLGWKRVFEQRGWDFVCVTMYKDLTHA